MALFESNAHFERNINQATNWTSEEDAQLKALIKEGKTLHFIAKEMKRKPFAIIMHIRYMTGFESHDTKGTKPEKLKDQTATLQEVYTERMQKWSDDDNVRLAQKYENGENIYQLSAYFHRSLSGILMHLQELYKSKKSLESLFDRTKVYVGRTRIINPVEKKTTEHIPEPGAIIPEAEETPKADYTKYAEEQRALYENFGKRWTKDDMKLLEILFVEKECSIEILSQVFRHNPKGITLKLVAMGLMEAPTE